MANDTINVQRGIIGAGIGDDTYLISEYILDANANITISDSSGANKIQFVSDIVVEQSKVAPNTILIETSNGAQITILDADSFEFEVGGNPLAGTSGTVFSYSNFAETFLNTSVPESGLNEGGKANISDTPTNTEDDYSADISTAGSLVVGTATSGEFEAEGDHDWLEVELTKGVNYNLYYNGGPTYASASSSNPEYIKGTIDGLYDSSGNYISGTTVNDSTNVVTTLSYTPTYTGKHYIAASAQDGISTGHYFFTVSPDLDDYPADASTTGEITLDSSDSGALSGKIETAGDLDWIKISLEVGKTYKLTQTGTSTGLIEGIYDSQGNIQANSQYDFANPDSRGNSYTFTPNASGDYYISVGDSQQATGNFLLTVSAYDDDFAAATNTLGQVFLNASYTGDIEVQGDKDWYKTNLEMGKTYRYTMKPDNGSNISGSLALFDSQGNAVTNAVLDTSDPSAVTLSYTPTSTSTYYLQYSAGDSTGKYQLLFEVEQDDYPADISTTGEIILDSSGSGSLSGKINTNGDIDWIKVSLEAGKTYQITQTDGNGNTSLTDRMLSLYDSNGNLVPGTVTTSQNGADNLLTYTSDTTATYYVAAAASGSSTGSYKVSLSVSDDYSSDTNTTGELIFTHYNGTLSGGVGGSLETAGDTDWIKVDLEVGKTYGINQTGTEDGYIRGIYDSQGDYIINTNSSIGNTDTRENYLTYTPNYTGTHYISVGDSAQQTGSFLLITSTFEDDYRSDVNTSGALNLNSTITGTVEQWGDADWFKVTLAKNTNYQITLDGHPGSVDQLDNGMISLYDSTGNLLTDTVTVGQDGEIVSLSYTPSAAGTYYISASASDHLSGDYLLSFIRIAGERQ